MRCPKCGDEYRPGFTECADCRVPLVEDAAPDESPDERPEGHSEGPWAVLAQHSMDTAWVSLDSGSLALLELESELEAKGIDVGFDPFRPGEGGSFSPSERLRRTTRRRTAVLGERWPIVSPDTSR